MKVLLTGATGFLGSEVARELARQGHAVRALVRATSRLDGLRGVPFERAEGDVTDRAAVTTAARGVDAVLHVAGATSGRRRDREATIRTNVEGTRAILEATASRPTMRVVVTSTVAAIGAARTPHVLDESARWNLGGIGYHYAESKREAEELALTRARAGANIVVLNPGMILGPGDVYLTSTRYVLEYLRGWNRFAVRGGLSFCDVREVAKAHVAALTKGRAGERYILAGQNVTHLQALRALQRVTGLHRPIPIPGSVLGAVAVFSELLARVVHHSLEDFTRAMARVARMYLFMDPAKARRELGYVVRPFDESLRDTVRDLVDRGLFPARTPALAALGTSA
jgi:dihydroflavonol-4-reductase